jgi:hypothetical protein
MRVLVIEDHEDLAGVLARGLGRDLPVLHGDELCRRLRAQGAGTRVLMLTAAGGPRRAAEGLGADDYLASRSISWS